ncbi:MAG TPA: tetratricopeptide repeat protein, partial [Blastocatellia bacterium]|nr:tetratricopeptide repeat protein [Blastocatellia bacterium]
ESVSLVAEAAGDYRLVVRPVQEGGPAGRYEIRIEELRPATENDRELQRARRLFEELLKMRNAGRYDEALLLAKQTLEIRERILGPNHHAVGAALSSLAGIHFFKGEYAEAESAYQRALAIMEKALGPEHPDLGAPLNGLAVVYNSRGDYARAEPLYQRALAIREKRLGPEHPKTANALHNLANLYANKGQYAKAEQFYQRALAIREKMLGPEHPDVAVSLNSLAALHKDLGDYARAEPLYQRALAITEKALGPEHPDLATLLNNLGIFYYDRGDPARAEPLYQRALAIKEKMLGPEHPEIAASLNSLGIFYFDRGDYSRAKSLYQRALVLWEKTVGPESPEVATSLNNLAELYKKQGQFAKAEPVYQRVLALREKVLGPEHPEVAKSLHNLAALSAARGQIHQAIIFQLRANTVSERNLTLNLTIGSERQKLAYLTLFSSETDFTLSLSRRAAPNDAQALDLALTTLLRRKGRALDAMTDTIGALRRRAAPQDQLLLDQLVEARSRLAATTLRESGEAKPETVRAQLKPLEERVDELEAALSARSAEFRTQSQPVTIADVQAALPAQSTLVEYAVYRPRDLQTGKNRPPRYLVYLLSDQGPPKSVDLGPAARIDRAVDAWRKALRDSRRTDVKQLARAADEVVMQPVRSVLGARPGETRRLLIAADGSLNLIPFAALVDRQDQYLVERYAISYLTSGRDLLRLRTSQSSRNAPVIVADPLFDSSATVAVRSHQPGANQEGTPLNPAKVFFKPLPGTRREALAIRTVLPGALMFVREQATEAALKQSRAPSLLHIATHGFFLSDQNVPPARARSFSGDGPPGLSDLRLSRWAAKIENPLLRSGLALTGANQRGSEADDGVLTALEASSLDLWGTRLVVLSACDTGVGQVKNGEGVYGLRRALVLAGSETQVISLWPVLDDATGNLMARYYGRLLKGEGRGEALRQIQLEMLKDQRRQHPYYWANFIQAGEWDNLDGQQ